MYFSEMYKIKLSMHITYLAVSCRRALRKVSGWNSSARSSVSESKLCFSALSTQFWNLKYQQIKSAICILLAKLENTIIIFCEYTAERNIWE